MPILEKFYIVNLKYAVGALRDIRDLDPGMWQTAQKLADNALKDMDGKLLQFIHEEIEAEKGELIK